MSDKIGDQPIEPRFASTMKKIANTIDDIYNGDDARTPRATVGFILMVFPFGGPGFRTNYISNADKDDVIALLEDQVKRLKERRGGGNA
jgi:hypothetical protein